MMTYLLCFIGGFIFCKLVTLLYNMVVQHITLVNFRFPAVEADDVDYFSVKLAGRDIDIQSVVVAMKDGSVVRVKDVADKR